MWVASREGLASAQKLCGLLPAFSWQHCGQCIERCVLYVPERLACANATLCRSLVKTFRARFRDYSAHVVFGAAGIAVRFLGPVIAHKENDPAVVVIDSAARYVISLLSGHWGGGNSLARHLASLLQAMPVITTASDGACERFALDLAVQKSGLRLLDWHELPALQGRLLEGQSLALYDPFGALAHDTDLLRACGKESLSTKLPLITVHWRDFPPQAGRLRIVIPHFVCGVGFRKNTEPELFVQAFAAFCRRYGISQEAVTAFATIDAKAQDSGLHALASSFRVPIDHFPAEILACEQSPNPSELAGKVFQQPAFSVCEACAQISAKNRHPKSVLFFPKTRFFGKITFAAAGSAAFVDSGS
ncbi:MAG: cobalamin biosynthesis protein [Desulfovibrio sp.]|nr:cobalamin biosynthesis protein [Desulfovibrio sp.]